MALRIFDAICMLPLIFRTGLRALPVLDGLFAQETKLLEKGSISLKEEIADDIENSCEFSLKRLHNYTPQ